MRTHEETVKFIWDIAELLRGPYRPPQYERVMLPMTVLRRFDCALEATKAEVLTEYEPLSAAGYNEATIERMLEKKTAYRFHNHSKFDFRKLLGDPENLAQHLESYIQGFSSNVRRIFDYFEFRSEISRMSENNILFLIIRRFSDVDLHPETVDNIRMGQLFEELIRRFNEQANETAGDYFTPREVIRLMVDLLFIGDDDALRTPGTIRTLLDPACGTGGMLSEAQKHVRQLNPAAKLFVYGQDFNQRAYAIAASDLLMKEQVGSGGTESQVEHGDSFLQDKYSDKKFDYFLANPPFGVDWIIPYQDSDLEKLYTFLRYLGTKLPRKGTGPSYTFDDDVRLKYYRIQKISEGSISLADGNAVPLEGPSSTGTGLVREERVRLSKLIDVMNDRFGTDFTESDQLFFDQIVEDATSDSSLAVAANANPVDKFALLFGGHVESLMIDRMGQNEEIFGKYMSDPTFQSVVNEWLAAEVYRKLQKPSKTGEESEEYDTTPGE